MEDYYRRLGRDLIVLDLTHDLGIPVFAAQSARHDHAREEIILGFGADLDPRVALSRALRELTQFHPLIAERGDGGRTIYRTGNQDAIRWLAEEGRGGNPHLVPAPGRIRALSDFVDQPPSDPCVDIAVVTRALAAAGIDAYVLDQTRPDIGIAVARTIAPGLRHFWRRLAPGRLYDVPVALGWLDKPRSEAEINPISIFF
jgi:ribosomal protein S12 methylthiotransferase accessory factor